MAASKRLKLHPVFRLSMEGDKDVILDQTDALLLRRVSETHSLTEGAKLAGISYRNAWDRIKTLESHIGTKVIDTKVGGIRGGGAEVTPTVLALLGDFRRVRKFLFNSLDSREYMAHAGYKLSARNRIKAKVSKVEKGTITASVKMVVTGPVTLTSIISREAVEDLKLKEGDEVEAIIKSTEVIVAKES